ncbi:hypothetical protein JHK82_031517 [Glycine max]|nr:hypothetical protein JHK85_032169 [Glycine max]KAG5124780.1 hypothetical protein JHK82_031517 [Glycine max]
MGLKISKKKRTQVEWGLAGPRPNNKVSKTSCSVDKREASLQVEDACKKFENYLVEMVVEEGKMRDLLYVEELLHCWKNLKCPVFKYLFSSYSEEGSSIPTNG